MQRPHDERGSGLLSTTIGLLMLMGLLLFSLHVLLALHTRTLVGAAAWDVARAMSVEDAESTSTAQQRANNLIGRLRPKVDVSASDSDTIVVSVSATSPGFLPGVTSLDGLRKITRTVRMQREELK
jgi:Flp pilus assembly protein TadG